MRRIDRWLRELKPHEHQMGSVGEVGVGRVNTKGLVRDSSGGSSLVWWQGLLHWPIPFS